MSVSFAVHPRASGCPWIARPAHANHVGELSVVVAVRREAGTRTIAKRGFRPFRRHTDGRLDTDGVGLGIEVLGRDVDRGVGVRHCVVGDVPAAVQGVLVCDEEGDDVELVVVGLRFDRCLVHERLGVEVCQPIFLTCVGWRAHSVR